MSVNPSTTAVNRPNQAIVQKNRRKGRLTTNQSVVIRVTSISPQNHELGCLHAQRQCRSVRSSVVDPGIRKVTEPPSASIAISGCFRTGLASFFHQGKLRRGSMGAARVLSPKSLSYSPPPANP